MIYVEMYGRLGNQFFRYAVIRALQEKYYPNDKLILCFGQIDAAYERDQSFYNVLKDFNIKDYDIYKKSGKVIFNESSLMQKMYCIPYYIGMYRILPEQMNKQVNYEQMWHKCLEKMEFIGLEEEDGTDPVWKKLRLMSACKHFIISNSTSSWWAQYLSRNDNKIIVSPSRWFNNDYESPLIGKNWIKILV